MNHISARISMMLIAVAGLVVALKLGGGAWQPPTDSIGDAGQVMTWTNQILVLINTLIGLRVLGLLVVYGFIAPQAGGTLDRAGRQVIIRVAKFSVLWAVISFSTAITTMSTVLGTTFSQTFTPGTISTYIWSLIPSRSFLIVTMIALVIAGLAFVSTSLNSVALLSGLAIFAVSYPLLNSHSASLGDHSLAITSSVIHSASMSLWVGSLMAMWPFIKSNQLDVIKRFSVLATISVIALLISGIVAAATRMQSLADIYQSSYGFLVLCKVVLFGTIACCALSVRTSLARTGQASAFIVWELATMVLAVGVGVALHFTAPSRVASELISPSTSLLGFPIPPAPSFSNYFFGWNPEWFLLIVALILATLYTMGLIRLKQKDIKWSPLRTMSFFAGISLIIWVSSSGISRYAMVTFSAHMIQHMTLSMIAPIFIILSAPITLALRALPASSDRTHRNARGWILGLLHSRYTFVATQPLFVLFLFTVGLYGIYFTSAFSALMASHVGHVFMEFHFLMTGLLFTFVIIGVDPSPRKVPYWGKLLLVLVAISVHTFFALALMQSTAPIGAQWYYQVQPSWITDPLSDTYSAGGITWALGEVPSLLLLLIVAVQWSKSDTRLAKQFDRAAQRDGDAQLNAYNDNLARLNQQDTN